MHDKELLPEVRLTTIMAGIIAVMLLCTGCMASMNQPQDEHTYTVLNKEFRSQAYLLEIASPTSHEYAAIEEKDWNNIRIGDSVTFNSKKQLTKINNTPIDH